jgi:hypothetical protein
VFLMSEVPLYAEVEGRGGEETLPRNEIEE